MKKILFIVSLLILIIFEYINRKYYHGLLIRSFYLSYILVIITILFEKKISEKNANNKFSYLLFASLTLLNLIVYANIPKTIDFGENTIETKYNINVDYRDQITYLYKIDDNILNLKPLNYYYGFENEELKKQYIFNPYTLEIKVIE
ncbi:hypothetical protein ACWOAQ_07890 [Helcococcus kunzii]